MEPLKSAVGGSPKEVTVFERRITDLNDEIHLIGKQVEDLQMTLQRLHSFNLEIDEIKQESSLIKNDRVPTEPTHSEKLYELYSRLAATSMRMGQILNTLRSTI